jgi:PKD repeat protein
MRTPQLLKQRMNRITVYLLGILLFAFLGDSYASPNASFTANQRIGCAPLNVEFTNTSTGAVSYYWDMGNGNTSTMPNPSNLYTSPGSYTVFLVAIDASGNRDTATYLNYIIVSPLPTAGFYASSVASCLDNNSFQFINTSTGASSYLWDFGDGNTSTSQNPSHSYTLSGVFTVTLIATNSYGCSDQQIRNEYITIYPKPDALVSVSDTMSCDPSTVFHFTSNEIAASLQWNFGDGNTSTQQNPNHIYVAGGNYPVSLILVNSFGCRDTSESVFIHVGSANWVSFNAHNDSGCSPLSVTFTNATANRLTCSWDFGDGDTTSGEPTIHTYTTPGWYDVTYNITTSTGCTGHVTRVHAVHVLATPTVDFNYNASQGCSPFSVQFTNLSTSFDSCFWNFGDGFTSNQINPTHIFTGNGTFNITLTCWNDGLCPKSKTITNAISVTRAKALFSASPRVGCPPLTVNFTNFSAGNGLTYFWDFGDGNTSTQQIPSHTYITSGSFNVKLIVTDVVGCRDTLYKPGYVQTVNPAANYVPPPPTSGCAPMTTQFTDQTQGSVSWLWNFGDGDTSTLQNPVHTYDLPGTYTVSLTTVSSGGGCIQTINNFSTFIVHGGYAGFTHTDSQCPPYESCFHDTSYHAVSWLWDFGDGSYSTDQNPCHNYAAPGYHSVSLTITTVDGCTYTTMQSNTVYFPPFGANFYGIPNSSTYPMDVQFYANSTGATGWFWDFGDGNTSTEENPLHTYLDSCGCTVTLIIYNDLCTLELAHPPIQVGEPDTSGISVGNEGTPVVQKGCAPLNVNFSQIVLGAVAWHWDFGDGDTSNLQFPHHLYTQPGIYDVYLVTWDTLGLQSDFPMDSMVRVYGPAAHFGFAQQSACVNTQIALHDSSINAAHWNWNFGDGNNSTQQNPIHTYLSDLPNYIVTLTVTDTIGCSSSISTSIYASFISPMIASETEVCGYDTVHFYTSLQNYASYLWNFGDNNTSADANPTHLYTGEGEYPTSLTVTDFAGCSQTFSINPNISVHLPQAGFTINDRQNCDTLRAIFTNTSQNAEGYFWTFGDGGTSTLENPLHIYLPGIYDATLTIYDGGCIDTYTLPQAAKVDTAHADFTEAFASTCLPIQVSFTDQSINAVSWLWQFGFTGIDTSVVQNPVFTYLNGTSAAAVILSIIDINGCRAEARHAQPPSTYARFSTSADSGCVPVTVHFSNSSGAIGGVYWDFGDGDTSTAWAPTHTYTTPGDFNVMLVAFSGSQYGNCSDTLFMPAKIKAHQPKANFSTPDIYACAPYLVHFVDSSFQADSYLWDFGDSATSTNASPEHVYTQPGIYTVTLTVRSNMGECSDVMTRPQYITVLGPVTHFTSTTTQGCSPFTVNFTDASVNAIDWAWNFGDGYSALTTDASHTFNDTGTFTVTLVTHDTAGCSSYYELPQKVEIHPTPVASFTMASATSCMNTPPLFTNTSQFADSVLWYFGDGSTSTDFNPNHVYTQPGTYYPSLVVSTRYGCRDSVQSSTPITILATPQVTAISNINSGCSPLVVSCAGTVIYADNASWLWDFGNGVTSTQPYPTVTLSTPGIYPVTLTVTNANGCGTTVTLPSIQVFDSLPPPISKILSVSVVDNSSVEITWENNTAVDLEAYILYRLNTVTNQYQVIYSDTNLNNTTFSFTPSYIDRGLNTLSNIYTYKLQTIDACHNAIPLSQLTAHSTINVSSQRAGQGIAVSWNPYGGCPVNTYKISRCRAGAGPSTWELLAEVPSSTLNYLDTSFDCPYGYAYRITATDLCGNPYISNSDTSITIPEDIFADQKVDMVRSTVVENLSVLTEWLPPVVHPEKVVQYDLYRSTDNVNFHYLTSLSPMQTDYMDNDVDVQTAHYYYKIRVLNTCDIAEDLSGNTSTILLKGTESEDYNITLKWNPYMGWDTGVDYYIIEKMEDGGSWQLLKKVDGTVIDYTYHE